ncbi:MAG: VOC family protein [Woeseiaceae bacterium]|jgi:catechol 2,3-dioxygenase-like lactoylglutathione lyase family enzyme|nr:VOC family protein [Woeseiaceae bacterium]|tara:strand:+ start:2388 stop:2768 length:381 start_codon:yes stop_codon:yes gene_type:complete
MNGKLVGYVCVGTNDLEVAKGFYDNLFATLDVSGFSPGPRGYFYQVEGGTSAFGVIKPENGNEATVGNGAMVALPMDSKEQVDEFYAKAMELGATDEGAPGARMETFYGAYIRDLDGNKIAFYYLG